MGCVSLPLCYIQELIPFSTDAVLSAAKMKSRHMKATGIVWGRIRYIAVDSTRVHIRSARTKVRTPKG